MTHIQLKQISFTLLFFAFASLALAQKQNILSERDFWKGSPTVQAVQQKIGEGNDPTQLNRFAFDPMVYAILEKAPMDVMRLLLEQEGNDVNKITHDGRTYLFWAAYKDNLPLMKHLFERGALTDVIDDHGYSLLNFAAVTGQQNPKLYDFIFAHGASVSEKNNDGANALLLLLPHLKNEDMVTYFNSKGTALSDTDNDGNGAFNYTAKGGNIDMLKWLIDQGSDVQTLSANGENAMLFASKGMRGHENNLEVFEFLDSEGIKTDIITKSGTSPLLAYAADGGDLEVFKFFLAKGADPDHVNKEGNTALMLAAKHNNIRAVRMLLAESENVNAANSEGRTALMNAVQSNTADVVRLLLDKGADAQAKDREGNNLLYYLIRSYSAKEAGDFEEKRAYLEGSGLNLATPQANGNTLYHLAAQLNDLPLLKGASEMGLDINAKNKEGLTPLHIAAMKAESDAVMKYLLSQGADKSIRTAFDESAHDLAHENEVLNAHKTDLKFLEIE